MIPKDVQVELKEKLKNIKVNVQNFVFLLLGFIIFITFAKEAGYANNINNLGIFHSVIVAFEGIVNPNSEVAQAGGLAQVAGGDRTNYVVEDVFDRGKVSRGEISTSAYHKIYDSKVGFNSAILLGDASAGDQLLNYWRGQNKEGLDLFGSNVVAIVTTASPDNVADFIIKANDLGMMPIIRLCLEQQGVCPFDLSQNEDPLVDFYTKIGERLKAKNGEYRAVVTFGPNELNTSLPDALAAFGTPGDVGKLVKRARDAINRLQEYRVVRGGNLYFAPAIFNCTQITYPDNAEDVQDYMDGRAGKDENGKVIKMDVSQLDALLCNSYSFPNSDAYNFYALSGAKDYVDKNDNLSVIFTETGLFFGSVDAGSFKSAFDKFCKDDKVDSFNLFRAIKDLDLNDNPPKPAPEQMFTLKDILRLAEGCVKGSKKISLAPVEWVNWLGYSGLYTNVSSPVSSGGGGGSTTITASKFVGINEGRPVTEQSGIDSDITYAKSAGLGGYMLGIAINPGDVDAAASFINKAGAAGFVPILRFCVVG